jgi:hypothetical protein
MADLQASLSVIHGLIRWIILSLAIVGAARSLVSLLTRDAKFMRLDVGLSNAYAGILDLQALLGVLLVIAALILQMSVPWIHPIIMIPAIVVAHQNRRFRDKPDRVRHQAQLAIFVGSLILIAIGLLVIGQLRLP